MRYRKKPVVIEAFQWSLDGPKGPDERSWPEWLHEAAEKLSYDHHGHKRNIPDGCFFRDDGGHDVQPNPHILPHQAALLPAKWWIRTLEGDHQVRDRDFIIQGVKGELYPCKPDIFEETYEKVGD